MVDITKSTQEFNKEINKEINQEENIINNRFSKYNNLVENINYHIKRYSQFVNTEYFEEVYGRFKTQEELKLLKDFSETIFHINNDTDLENFMKYAQKAEQIMTNTNGMIGFCKSFAECFVWHIQEIIIKIKIEIKIDDNKIENNIENNIDNN
jgi:hypothetical protein